MDEPERRTSDPDQAVLDAAREHDRDRYLAALLAPADAQSDLVVLSAYLGEIKRIPLTIQDPAAGEIRLQWWRDTLASGQRSGNPVADALLNLQQRRGLSPELLVAPLEGHSRELYEDGIRDAAEFALYAEETEGAALRLALNILGGEAGEGDSLVVQAGQALAVTRLALTLPQHLAHGRLPLPADVLDTARDPRGMQVAEAREATRGLLTLLADEASQALARFRSDQAQLAVGLRPGFLPVCLVAPYLKSVLRPGRDVLTQVADISPLSRVMRLWFAHWRGRI